MEAAMKIRLMLLLAAAGAAAMIASAQEAKGNTAEPALVGDWRGDSICVVRPSACHDEKALYRISKTGNLPNHYSIEGDKIVDGKPEYMGTFECTYAPEKRALACSTPKLLLHLTLDGKNLNGTMNLRDGTVWRNITLRHD
jgi:hypothetical protein